VRGGPGGLHAAAVSLASAPALNIHPISARGLSA